jgi:hypothetical protein
VDSEKLEDKNIIDDWTRVRIWHRALARALLKEPLEQQMLQELAVIDCHVLCLVRELSRQWDQMQALQYMFDRENLDKEVIQSAKTLPLLPLWQTQRSFIKEQLDLLYSATDCKLLSLGDELAIWRRTLDFVIEHGTEGDQMQLMVLLYHVQHQIYVAGCHETLNVLNLIGNGSVETDYSSWFYRTALCCLWLSVDWRDRVQYRHRYRDCWYKVSVFDLLLCLVEALLQRPSHCTEFTCYYGTASSVLERVCKLMTSRVEHTATWVNHLNTNRLSPYYKKTRNAAVLHLGRAQGLRVFDNQLVLPSVKQTQQQGGSTVYSLVHSDDDVNF